MRGFRHDEPGARHRRRQGLSREAKVGFAGVALGDGRVALVTQPPPQIDFPRQAQHAAVEHGDEVGHGVGSPAPQDADRGLQLRGGQIDLGLGLLDAGGRRRKIRVVGEGFCHKDVELRVVEGRQPAGLDGRSVRWRRPGRGDLHVAQGFGARAFGRRLGRGRASGEKGRR
ncbi:hypothetical protein D3C81_1403260 [compost metagenome]